MLQGEGITLILDGQTDIKKGITTSTFNAVPDAPVSSFETTLPEGPHSALTSNVPESKDFSLCGTKLTMPTTITAQNGAVITQQTKIPVLGCGAVAGVKFTRSQKLAKALKKCRREFRHSKQRRGSCEAKARKRYGGQEEGGEEELAAGGAGEGCGVAGPASQAWVNAAEASFHLASNRAYSRGARASSARYRSSREGLRSGLVGLVDLITLGSALFVFHARDPCDGTTGIDDDLGSGTDSDPLLDGGRASWELVQRCGRLDTHEHESASVSAGPSVA